MKLICDECREAYEYEPNVELDYTDEGEWIERERVCGECQ